MRHCDRPSQTTEYRFWQQICRVPSGHPELKGDCWEWTGGRDKNGYGQIFIGKKFPHVSVNEYVHIYAYEMLVGPIPPDMTVDHLCRNRACANPDHFEIVAQGENTRRGESFSTQFRRQTHCKRGHPLSGDNLYVYKGMRHCRTCAREKYLAKKAAILDASDPVLAIRPA